VTEAFLCLGDAWEQIREGKANEKQEIWTLMVLYLCTEIIEGKNLAGISGSVEVTPPWLSPAHPELNQHLPLKTTGHSTSSLATRACDGCLVFRGKLGSRAKGFSMAGHHVAMKPRGVIPKLRLGFLTSLTNAFI